MPARKAVSKKTKKKSTTRKAAAKKTAKKKSASKAGKKKTVTSKKSSARKKATKKKAPVRKAKASKASKASKKKAPSKAAKKKAAKKTPAKKAAAKKKASPARKKATSGTAKKVSKKPAARKAAAKRPAAPRKQKITARASATGRQRRTPSRTTELKASTNLLNGPLRGFTPYEPTRGEEYMSDGQLDHFREILSAWKRELMEEVDRTVLHMKDDAANFPDPNDRATQESEFGLELRTRDRERKLLRKIDSALTRIDDGSYGYCEETGDEIGLRRLEARPVATLCVEAQERRELAERQYRDREDYYR